MSPAKTPCSVLDPSTGISMKWFLNIHPVEVSFNVVGVARIVSWVHPQSSLGLVLKFASSLPSVPNYSTFPLVAVPANVSTWVNEHLTNLGFLFYRAAVRTRRRRRQCWPICVALGCVHVVDVNLIVRVV